MEVIIPSVCPHRFSRLPPDDCSPTLTKRPWENSAFETTIERTHLYHTLQLNSKFFQKRINTIKKIPDDEWTIFPGDRGRTD